jgi:hypothetical protein
VLEHTAQDVRQRVHTPGCVTVAQCALSIESVCERLLCCCQDPERKCWSSKVNAAGSAGVLHTICCAGVLSPIAWQPRWQAIRSPEPALPPVCPPSPVIHHPHPPTAASFQAKRSTVVCG